MLTSELSPSTTTIATGALFQSLATKPVLWIMFAANQSTFSLVNLLYINSFIINYLIISLDTFKERLDENCNFIIEHLRCKVRTARNYGLPLTFVQLIFDEFRQDLSNLNVSWESFRA